MSIPPCIMFIDPNLSWHLWKQVIYGNRNILAYLYHHYYNEPPPLLPAVILTVVTLSFSCYIMTKTSHFLKRNDKIAKIFKATTTTNDILMHWKQWLKVTCCPSVLVLKCRTKSSICSHYSPKWGITCSLKCPPDIPVFTSNWAAYMIKR